jgi:transposase
LTVLFPHLAGLRVERVFTRGRSVRITVASEAGKAACPDCGVYSARVHSRYERRLSDMAVGGQDLMIHLRARRFMCDSSSCSRKTFAERFPELVVPYGRRTLLLRRTLEMMALASVGDPPRDSLEVYVSRCRVPRCCDCCAPFQCPRWVV